MGRLSNDCCCCCEGECSDGRERRTINKVGRLLLSPATVRLSTGMGREAGEEMKKEEKKAAVEGVVRYLGLHRRMNVAWVERPDRVPVRFFR